MDVSPAVTCMEGNVLFNDALNTFYTRLHGVGHTVKGDVYDEGRLQRIKDWWLTIYNITMIFNVTIGRLMFTNRRRYFIARALHLLVVTLEL